MKNVMPVLEVKARRVGGSNYQVPVEVRPERRTTLGLRWVVNYARLRGEHTMEERLAKEIMDAANNTGASVKTRRHTQNGRRKPRICSLSLVRSLCLSRKVAAESQFTIDLNKERSKHTKWQENFHLKNS